MASDGHVLTGLNFLGSKHCDKHCLAGERRNLPAFRETKRWLDVYFSGRQPDFTPPYSMRGITPFRQDVVDEMLKIPFGETVTYGEIARAIAARHNRKTMSARAVGGAVGWNPICLIVPCHRVIGTDGSMTGYGGGLENKIALLALER
ncbi:MAG: methylated-DNA--[Kiritimatiellae bacterium]|nr:methylated-DNA--[protein]-cysteine S-methyltransferase [Kiritimatiellia bacterium]